MIVLNRVPPAGEQNISLHLEPGDTVLLAPAHHAAFCLAASSTHSGPRHVDVELFDGYAIPESVQVPIGEVVVRIHNRLSQPVGYIVAPPGNAIWPAPAPPAAAPRCGTRRSASGTAPSSVG